MKGRLCMCGHDRAYHIDAYQCIAKRDLYQCVCWIPYTNEVNPSTAPTAPNEACAGIDETPLT